MTIFSPTASVEDEPIAHALGVWLEDGSNVDRPIPSGDLFKALAKSAEQAGAIFPFKSPVGFGQRLKHLTNNLEDTLSLKIHVQKGNANKTLYTFSRRSHEDKSFRETSSPF